MAMPIRAPLGRWFHFAAPPFGDAARLSTQGGGGGISEPSGEPASRRRRPRAALGAGVHGPSCQVTVMPQAWILLGVKTIPVKSVNLMPGQQGRPLGKASPSEAHQLWVLVQVVLKAAGQIKDGKPATAHIRRWPVGGSELRTTWQSRRLWMGAQ